MNLFVLSLLFTECVEAMFDKHISKMILESAQMLCTVKRVIDSEEAVKQAEKDIHLYKISHLNHPVTIWMRQSLDNYLWTCHLVKAMHEEWKYRYDHPADKIHSSFAVVQYLTTHAPAADKFPTTGLTEFAQAMPEQYKVSGDAVAAYRNYYMSDDKRRIASWKKRGAPNWWIEQNATEKLATENLQTSEKVRRVHKHTEKSLAFTKFFK